MLLLDEIVYWTEKYHWRFLKWNCLHTGLNPNNQMRFIISRVAVVKRLQLYHVQYCAKCGDPGLLDLFVAFRTTTFWILARREWVYKSLLGCSNFFNYKHTHTFESEAAAQHCVNVCQNITESQLRNRGTRTMSYLEDIKLNPFPPSFVTNRDLLWSVTWKTTYSGDQVGAYPRLLNKGFFFKTWGCSLARIYHEIVDLLLFLLSFTSLELLLHLRKTVPAKSIFFLGIKMTPEIKVWRKRSLTICVGTRGFIC